MLFSQPRCEQLFFVLHRKTTVTWIEVENLVPVTNTMASQNAIHFLTCKSFGTLVEPYQQLARASRKRRHFTSSEDRNRWYLLLLPPVFIKDTWLSQSLSTPRGSCTAKHPPRKALVYITAKPFGGRATKLKDVTRTHCRSSLFGGHSFSPCAHLLRVIINEVLITFTFGVQASSIYCWKVEDRGRGTSGRRVPALRVMVGVAVRHGWIAETCESSDTHKPFSFSHTYSWPNINTIVPESARLGIQWPELKYSCQRSWSNSLYAEKPSSTGISRKLPSTRFCSVGGIRGKKFAAKQASCRLTCTLCNGRK